jgi:hypothetical protein
VRRAALIAVLALAAAAAGCRSRPEAPAVRDAHNAPPATPPLTPDACRACRGDWGVHGLADKETCNCRTTDAGKRCRDGADCQGMCIAAEIPEREVTAPGPPPRGYFVGRCSELVTVFGCNRIVDRGVLARGPVPLAEPPQMICVD